MESGLTLTSDAGEGRHSELWEDGGRRSCQASQAGEREGEAGVERAGEERRGEGREGLERREGGERVGRDLGGGSD